MLKSLLMASALTMAFSGAAMAQTTMPLNTGYNHATYSPYATPAAVSTIQDNYWIKIASYEPPASSTSVDPAWVIAKGGWTTPLPNSHWIGPRNVNTAPTGSSPSNPAYSIFRKCFCLMKNFKDARLNFQMRGDDNVQVWFNSVTNTLVAPQSGQWNGPTINAQTQSGFKTGKNCIYVLVEDTQNGQMGFNLAGSVSAQGLMPQPAAGVGQSFEPCKCESNGPVPGMAQKTVDEDKAVLAEIVKIAESRRKASMSAAPKGIDLPRN